MRTIHLTLISEQFNPSGLFAGAAGACFIGIMLYLGVIALGVLATYWLIRLAVRHGTKDTARWQAAGMPPRGGHRHQPQHAVAPAPQPEPRPWQPPGHDLQAPPRNTLDW